MQVLCFEQILVHVPATMLTQETRQIWRLNCRERNQVINCKWMSYLYVYILCADNTIEPTEVTKSQASGEFRRAAAPAGGWHGGDGKTIAHAHIKYRVLERLAWSFSLQPPREFRLRWRSTSHKSITPQKTFPSNSRVTLSP